MPHWLTDSIEMAVGLGCAAAAAGAWRQEMHLLATALGVAGVAAVAHAVVSLLS